MFVAAQYILPLHHAQPCLYLFITILHLHYPSPVHLKQHQCSNSILSISHSVQVSSDDSVSGYWPPRTCVCIWTHVRGRIMASWLRLCDLSVNGRLLMAFRVAGCASVAQPHVPEVSLSLSRALCGSIGARDGDDTARLFRGDIVQCGSICTRQ